MKYYLVPETMIKDLKELKNSQIYMQSHNTGSDYYRGEVDTKIEIFTKIKECETIDDERLRSCKGE